jgi:hypothetical protein
MKIIIIIFIVLILSLNIVYASCDDIEIEGLFVGQDISCKRLDRIRMTDIKCNPAPIPGNCWSGYNKARLILPENMINENDDIKNLTPHIKLLDWQQVQCTEKGVYEVKVIFDDGACEKTLTLDLTKEYTEPESGSRGGTSDDSDDKIIKKDDDFVQSIVEKHESLDGRERVQKQEVEPEIIRKTEPTKTVVQPVVENENNNWLLILLIVLVVILGILIIGYVILRKKDQEFY